MSLFHKHKFKKDGLILWCECGKRKKLKCPHEWISNGQRHTIFCGKIEHLVESFTCRGCGSHKHLNHTTGTVEFEIL